MSDRAGLAEVYQHDNRSLSPDGGVVLPSGRLKDRIAALRQ